MPIVLYTNYLKQHIVHPIKNSKEIILLTLIVATYIKKIHPMYVKQFSLFGNCTLY